MGFNIFFGVDIVAKLKNLFTYNPEIDIAVIESSLSVSNPTTVSEIKLSPQVFNIPGNTYVYQAAKALCSAYGARLATYKEVEDSYNNGTE